MSRLVQLFTNRTATSLKGNLLIVNPVHAVRLNLTAKQTRYLIDHGYTLVENLPVESVGAAREGADCGVQQSLSFYGFISAEMVRLESSAIRTSSRKKRNV